MQPLQASLWLVDRQRVRRAVELQGVLCPERPWDRFKITAEYEHEINKVLQ